MGKTPNRLQTAQWALVPLLVLLLIGGTIPAKAQGTTPAWSVVSGTEQGVNFNGVYLVDSDRAWAVARSDVAGVAHGVIYRLDLVGGIWQVTREETTRAPLQAIAAVSRDDVWAVGDNGLITYRASGTWHEVPVPTPNANFTTLQMLGDSNAGWASGYLPSSDGPAVPVLLRYDGTTWQPSDAFSGAGEIRSIHIGTGGGWAVGTSAGHTWHYMDGNWTTRDAAPNCGAEFGGLCIGGFLGVRALAGDEAWAVGYSILPCPQCRQQASIAYYSGGAWARVEAPSLVLPAGTNPAPDGSQLNSVAFANSSGFAAGEFGVYIGENPIPYPLLLRYSNGGWSQEQLPAGARGGLRSISMLDEIHALAVGDGGLILSYGYGGGSGNVGTGSGNPTDRIADPGNPALTYFPEVGHTLGGRFREYWQQNGGLLQFGFPLTEPFSEISANDGKTYTVQYFERNRFEYHPENSGTPYDVLLGLLGYNVTLGRDQQPEFKPLSAAPSGSVFFPETGHTLAPEFVAYWQQNGGLAVYGFPISEPFQEANLTDGKSYLVQYFERNRFEYHPENNPPYNVLLGLLGVQVLQSRGWIAEP